VTQRKLSGETLALEIETIREYSLTMMQGVFGSFVEVSVIKALKRTIVMEASSNWLR